MSNTLSDFNRRPVNFNQPQIETILPEHFAEQYPTFVAFIKKYYDYLELAAGRNRLDNIFYAKDFESTNEDFLPYLFYEILNNLGADLVDLPRLALKLGPQFLRVKGTEISIPSFFRYVYGVTADAFYPKTQMFIVGESEVGAESLRFIQDSFFYQILSIQIQSPLSATQWENVYKASNHPAGFALFAQTRFETVAGNIQATAPLAILDSAADAITLQDIGTATSAAIGVTTGVDSDDTARFYVDRGICTVIVLVALLRRRKVNTPLSLMFLAPIRLGSLRQIVIASRIPRSRQPMKVFLHTSIHTDLIQPDINKFSLKV